MLRKKETLPAISDIAGKRKRRLRAEFLSSAIMAAGIVGVGVANGILPQAHAALSYESISTVVKTIVSIIAAIPGATGAFKLIGGIAERASAGSDDPQEAASGTKKIASGLIGLAASIALFASTTVLDTPLKAIFESASSKGGGLMYLMYLK